MHLPFLDELPQFDLVALSDVSSDVLDGLSERYPRVSTHLDYAELLARDDVDAVAVCTPDHAAVAEEAHVLQQGEIAFSGPAADLLDNPVVLSSYLGR